MPSILILIPSFDNKHTINVIVYMGFDVYVQFQRKKIEKCQEVYLEEDNVSLDKSRSECFLLTYTHTHTHTHIYIYIYIYMRVFLSIKV